MSEQLMLTASQLTADSKSSRIVSSLFNLSFIACHETCLTCTGPDATDCQTCDATALLYLKDDGSCGSCPSNQYASSGSCTDCDAQCNSCTSDGISVPTNGCVCKHYTNMPDLTCVDACPSGTYLSGTSCYSKFLSLITYSLANNQPIFTSVLPSTITVSVLQDATWWFRTSDTDTPSNAITSTLVVTGSNNNVVTPTSWLTVVADTAVPLTNPPYNYKLVFTHSLYPALTRDTTATYSITITVKDPLST